MNIFVNPMFIFISAFMAFVLQAMVNLWFDVPLLTGTSSDTENLNILQSHPRCGLTSRGREECWWGCRRKKGIFGSQYFPVILTLIELNNKLNKIDLLKSRARSK